MDSFMPRSLTSVPFPEFKLKAARFFFITIDLMTVNDSNRAWQNTFYILNDQKGWQKMKKKLFIIIAGVAILLIIGAIIITSGLKDGKTVVLDGIDLSQIPNGSYSGTYKHGRWTNTVTVHVENGRITAIDIVKDVAGAGITNCSDEILHRVLEAQSTQVDAVSGATVTSKAYLKAIEDALQK